MPTNYSLTRLPDPTVLHDLTAHCRRDRAITAVVLAHLSEVDARKLSVPQGYPSMFAFCVHELGFSEDAACKRIRSARTARLEPVPPPLTSGPCAREVAPARGVCT